MKFFSPWFLLSKWFLHKTYGLLDLFEVKNNHFNSLFQVEFEYSNFGRNSTLMSRFHVSFWIEFLMLILNQLYVYCFVFVCIKSLDNFDILKGKKTLKKEMNKLYCTAEFQNVMQKTEAKKSPYNRYVNITYKSR